MKSFSTVRVTHRGSQRYMEKRRGRRELEVTQMRWGGINSGESGLASNHFLMCTPQLDCSEMFTELYREEKEEAGDRGGQKDRRGEWKGGRQIQPVTSSLSVLLCLKHTEIHRVGQRREGLGKRHRRPGGEKGESKAGESSQASNLTPKWKMGIEDWVLKGTKLVTNT